MNILILSSGTRNKIVQYFRKALSGIGNVIATDMNIYAPSLYDADRFYTVPPITASNYLDVIFDICRKENVSAVMSLIDPELSLLAKNKDKFRKIGVCVIGSPYELCERSLNKMDMYCWLSEHGYRCGKSYADRQLFERAKEAGEISYPVFVKPICGSASKAISEVFDDEELEAALSHGKGLMIQEYLKTREIGADVYIDLISGEVVSIFTKRKLMMRAGETDKAVSFKDEKLFALIEKFVKESGYSGVIDIDIFEIDGEFYISEVNPRFGGGYPHAYESGVNFMEMIVNNLQGKVNRPAIGAYDAGIVMMKYNEIRTVRNA